MNTGINGHRMFARLNADFPVKCQNSVSGKENNAFLKDVSADGAKLSLKEKISVNDAVSLLIKLPDGHDPLILKGSVVWTEEKGSEAQDAGIRFDGIKLMGMHRLVSVCR